MESSNSNLKEKELQLTQRLAKQRHSKCMTWFEQLETHLHDIYLLKLRLCFDAFKTWSSLINFGWQQEFKPSTRCEPSAYRRELLENLDTLEVVIHRVVNTYGVLHMKENEVNSNKRKWKQIRVETQIPKGNRKIVDMREVVDARVDIRPVNDEEPFAEVQLTALHNILANEQQHTEQSEPNYDTHLLETIDSNTTPTSTNMCHRGGEIDQDALLNAELLKTKDMEESFHSNKPCKNKEYPEFREFFVINDLKAQLQAKTTLICDLKNQIKSVKEATNEQLHKEKEHLKQTYKELYDTIKKTRVQNKDNSDSLISQINQKSVENADLKAQEKVFANAALKNELRKLKGNIVDSKFAKASILGKPPLQPSRNHLVVRQPNAFTSERPRMSRPRFASQVDEKNDLSKTVTPHYLPKVRESAAAKPHQSFKEFKSDEPASKDAWIKIVKPRSLERITKKRTKNKAKTTKPDSEWKRL
ncbi:hypothetical protein Tco_0251191 [Tanacetum coccineum]